jgi:hypothetical protein
VRYKNTGFPRAGSVAQVVECLPRKYEALNSNPSTTNKYNWLGLKTIGLLTINVWQLLRSPVNPPTLRFFICDLKDIHIHFLGDTQRANIK